VLLARWAQTPSIWNDDVAHAFSDARLAMKNIAMIVGLTLVATIGPAAAWNDHGHMMVAAIAYDQLTPKTKTRVAQLLALSTYPTNGRDNASAGDQAKAAFMMAATAPDAIKSDKTHFKDDGEDPTNTKRAPDASRNTGFDDPYMHKYWHYIDLPFSSDGTPLVQPPNINAQECIALFRKTLASSAPDAEKAYDLVWLLHLVGDIHQPLHATSRFTQAGNKTSGDIGGNSVKLCVAPCRDQLHGFWDDVLGSSENVSAAISAGRALPKADPALAAKSGEAVWVQESFQDAQKVVYVEPIADGNGPYTITAEYKAAAKVEAGKRVALAGARLAKLLNTELK
jgi:hypothetical protein